MDEIEEKKKGGEAMVILPSESDDALQAKVYNAWTMSRCS